MKSQKNKIDLYEMSQCCEKIFSLIQISSPVASLSGPIVYNLKTKVSSSKNNLSKCKVQFSNLVFFITLCEKVFTLSGKSWIMLFYPFESWV